MTEDDDSDLYEPGHNESWDFENAIVVEGRPNRVSRLSVGLRRGEIGELLRAADARGLTIEQFVRGAALTAARDGTPFDISDLSL